MTIVFLLEELSMKVFLQTLLPRILPEGVEFKLIAHEGKSDLERSIPRKLRAWQQPDARFVVVRDQDGGDCRVVKTRLATLCAQAGKPNTLVRIACRELEAWFLGDLATVETVFKQSGVARLQAKSKYRTPDNLGSPSRELEKLIPGYGKVAGARAMGPTIGLHDTCSASFKVFVQGVQQLSRPTTRSGPGLDDARSEP